MVETKCFTLTDNLEIEKGKVYRFFFYFCSESEESWYCDDVENVYLMSFEEKLITDRRINYSSRERYKKRGVKGFLQHLREAIISFDCLTFLKRISYIQFYASIRASILMIKTFSSNQNFNTLKNLVYFNKSHSPRWKKRLTYSLYICFKASSRM